MFQFILFMLLLLIEGYSLISIIIYGLICLIKKCKGKKLSVKLIKLRNRFILLGGVAIIMAGFIICSQHFASTPQIRDQSGKIMKNSISELKCINLNGHKEWISIRGYNKNNPVILFLAGGPGGSQMAAVRYHLAELEKNYVVVNWDQAGSCKSYHAVSVKEITVDTYVDDGYKLTRYLCEKFNKKKIYLVGESWGSALGIFLADRHPECYLAFIGTGQMVDFVQTEKMDYAKAIEIAKQNGDNKKLKSLKKIGKPPYYGKDVTLKSMEYLNYLNNYMGNNKKIYNSKFDTLKYIFSSEYGIIDKFNYIWGLVNTFNHVYPQLYGIDLRKDYLDIKIPVYFFIGKQDINAPISLAEEYYNKMNAPDKKLVWFEHSGHSPWINESKLFVEELRKVFQ